MARLRWRLTLQADAVAGSDQPRIVFDDVVWGEEQMHSVVLVYDDDAGTIRELYKQHGQLTATWQAIA